MIRETGPATNADRSRRIDLKHAIYIDVTNTPQLAKLTVDGALQPIPEDEPVILFRGRDKLALNMLHYYWALCEADGATDFQLQSLHIMIQEFANFASKSPTMKQPGSTMGH